MIVLSFYGFRRNKFNLFVALLVLFMALGLLFTSLLQPESALDALGAEEEGEAEETEIGSSSPSSEEGYPGEPQRVLHELESPVKLSTSPEAYWAAVLDAVCE